MNKNWLQSMLTPAKRAVSMWRDLADAIQYAFTERMGETEKTIVDNQSLLTMSKVELDKKQAELGVFFSVIDVPENEQGLALVHRLDQIHLKATEFPVKDMVRRSFNDMDMDWQALYAPIDQVSEPYGSRFIDSNAFEKMDAQQQEQYFLTSRGRMVLNLNQFMPPEEELSRIYNSIKDTIVPLLPLDIVFDGFFAQVQMTATFTLTEKLSFVEHAVDNFSLVESVTVVTEVTARFDIQFNIIEDWFSYDSVTESIRKPFDNRLVPLLGEQRLGTTPLSAPYNLEKYHSANPDRSIGESKYAVANWVNVGSFTKPTADRIHLKSTESGFLYLAINCIVGKRYIVGARKHGTANVAMMVSRSNTVGGKEKDIIMPNDIIGTYKSVFTATSITMYLIIEAPTSGTGVLTDIVIHELTEL